MKKIFLFAVTVLGTLMASGQGFYFEMPEGLELTGKQYHYDTYFLCETTDESAYLLVMQGKAPEIRILPPLEKIVRVDPALYKYVKAPMLFAGNLEWYISGVNGRMTVTANGSAQKINWKPDYHPRMRLGNGSVKFLKFMDYRYHYMPSVDYKKGRWDKRQHRLSVAGAVEVMRETNRAVNRVNDRVNEVSSLIKDTKSILTRWGR